MVGLNSGWFVSGYAHVIVLLTIVVELCLREAFQCGHMLLLQSLYGDVSTSYRVIVETFNKQISQRERVSRLEV